ncbi:transporter substrate-binding domain-containing protein [Vogesella sp. DC21W]|uniref:Transporter substrate-binding domain-containing protein n=1 Tax=Vogesella aquatica TaxID=2984206 RepID=A0ABT5IYP3_9NEIS|nr:transporter substrate-binding domain-containing protein [Vogesella aquatica]MDC7717673.1 transporter substrate-binding domain-containing protein [Vogesella aquatica]
MPKPKLSTIHPRRLAGGLLLLASITTQVLAADNTLIAVTEPWPPYNTFSNADTADGAHALILQRALALSGLTAPISVYPWARAMALAQSRPNTLLLSVARTPAREQQFIWIGKLSQTQQFLWRLDTATHGPEASLQQILRCCSICTIRKDVSEEALRQQDSEHSMQLVLTGSHHDCLRLLRSGSVAYMAGSPYRIQTTLQQSSLPATLLHKTTAIAPVRTLFLAASHGTPGVTVSKLQQAMQQLQQSGEHDRILQQILSRPLPAAADSNAANPPANPP